MNTSTTYGQRSCLFCGKPFEAVTLYQFFCSSECRGQRRRQQKAAYHARFKDRITALKKRVADLEEEIELLKRTESHELKEARKELDQLRAELEALRKERNLTQDITRQRTVEHPVNRAAPAVDTSGWDFCLHMSLRAPRLPCGEREECLGCERMGGNRRASSTSPEERVCPACGKTFAIRHGHQKYCSHHCRSAASKAKEKQAGNDDA